MSIIMRSAQVTIKVQNEEQRGKIDTWYGMESFLLLSCASLQSAINKQELPPWLALVSACLHQSTNQ